LILPNKAKDHSGKVFGRLTVKEPVGKTAKGGYILWRCTCSCGNETDVKSSHLVSNAVKSCGCLTKELSSKRIKMIHETGKHLYFIRCNEFVKIGRTDDLNRRVSQLKAANPYHISIVRFIEDGGYREKEFHEKFKDSLHSGEWFKLHDYEVVDAE